jgi:hypothetical protein
MPRKTNEEEVILAFMKGYSCAVGPIQTQSPEHAAKAISAMVMSGTSDNMELGMEAWLALASMAAEMISTMKKEEIAEQN